MKSDWNPTVCIEINSYCNARCPFCPTGNGKLKSRKQIDTELFKSVVKHLSKIRLINDKNNLVLLFNYGEPFLHTHINTILEILAVNKLKAGFSSNFINYPVISKKYLNIIGLVIFSLSGISNETYKNIHGGDISNVLRNFNRFLHELNSANSKNAIVSASWHRYRFNETELEKARDYFKKRNVIFRSCLAYLIDLEKNLEVIEAGGIKSEEGKKLNKILFLDKVFSKMEILRNKQKNNDFECPQYNILAINENGDLLTCCGLTNYHDDYKIGNIFDMGREEIYFKKRNMPICNKCISFGIPHYMRNDIDEFQKILMDYQK